MKIADLRYRITVQEIKESEKTDLGGRQRIFTDKFSCFAGVKVDNGEEKNEEDRSARNLEITFTIRYREDVHSSNRIKWDDRLFDITNIYPNALKTYLTIKCKEVIE